MKFNINEYSGLQGNVNIEVIGKNKKLLRKINVHNNGTVSLCEYLRNALAGDYVIAARPGIIVPCSRGTNGELVDIGKGTSLLNENPKKSSLSDSDDSSWCVLTFLIPSNLISSGIDVVGFKLYSKYNKSGGNNSKTLYASVDLEKLGEEPIKITNGSNLKVSWTLIVKILRGE